MQADTIFTLTALINMHSLLANVLDDDSDNGQKQESHRQAVNAAVEIVSISETFRKEDYTFLESFTMVSFYDARAIGSTYNVDHWLPTPIQLCWNVALAILEQERDQIIVLEAHIHGLPSQHRRPGGVHGPNLAALIHVLRECMRQIAATPPFVYQT